jgi:hypothetical protein
MTVEGQDKAGEFLSVEASPKYCSFQNQRLFSDFGYARLFLCTTPPLISSLNISANLSPNLIKKGLF